MAGMWWLLVQGGDVVVNVLLFLTVHTLQTIVHDDRNFVCVRRIVRDYSSGIVRTEYGCDHLRAAVAFAVQRGTTGSPPIKEAREPADS